MSASLKDFKDMTPKMGEPMPPAIEEQAAENPIDAALYRGTSLARLRAQAGARAPRVRNKPMEPTPAPLPPLHGAVRHLCVACANAEQADPDSRMCGPCVAEKRQPIVLPLPKKQSRRKEL